jgi:hypothetical protein
MEAFDRQVFVFHLVVFAMNGKMNKKLEKPFTQMSNELRQISTVVRE